MTQYLCHPAFSFSGYILFYMHFFNECVCLHTAAEVRRENVLGCDEQFLAEVSGLGGAVGQQLQHALYHLLRVFTHQVLTGWTQTRHQHNFIPFYIFIYFIHLLFTETG